MITIALLYAWAFSSLTFAVPLANSYQIPGWDYNGGPMQLKNSSLAIPLLEIKKKEELFSCPKTYTRAYRCPYHNSADMHCNNVPGVGCSLPSET